MSSRLRIAALGAALTLSAAVPAAAQYETRPWLDWRSLDTEHFTFHYPREAEAWTRQVAERMDAVREVVGAMVGYTPPGRLHVVVEDPFSRANGFAIPTIDRPLMLFWATPPTPRQSIGQFRNWGELLAVHEYAHVAHLTIPSRNARERLLMMFSPVRGGPVTLRAPRWVFEGYATYVEGRVTAHGRPHNAWRAAILRQWAMEGRLPAYGQLNGTQGYNAGAFAYLAGSAFLEHTARRDTLSGSADSSLAFLWRRLSARTPRNFDRAFAGMHGRSPADAYGRFVAELSASAIAIERAIEDSGGVVQGALVQRLAWETGDPAISPDGSRLALVVRSRENPSRVVVWRTGSDSAAADSARRAARAAGDASRDGARPRPARARDTLDVPDRRFVPPPKQVLASLRSAMGASYESPRFLGDGRHLLVTRFTPTGDGFSAHDLYVWDSDGGGVRRVTHGAAVRDADPSPDGRSAVGVRCRFGSCDVVRVTLADGEVTTLLEGSPERSFHRPRWSPDGRTFAVAMQSEGRWRLVIASHDGSGMREIGGADAPARFEPAFTADGAALVSVSERGGIMNLERVPLDGSAAHTLTRVSGAALAPDVNRADGSIWYLSLHSRGLDVRRLPPPDSAGPVAIVHLDTAFAPLVTQPATHAPPTLARGDVGASRAYDAPRNLLWVPGAAAGADGRSGRLVLSSSDLIGRLHLVATGAAGDAATWRGGALSAEYARWRTPVWGDVVFSDQRPSRSRAAGWERTPIADQLDAQHVAASLGVERIGDWQTHALGVRAGAQVGTLRMGTAGDRSTRTVGALQLDGSLRQRGDGWGLAQRIVAQGNVGTQGGERFARQVVTLGVAGAGRGFPLNASATYGMLHGTTLPYERFVVGGVGAPLLHPLFLLQRHAQPLLPLGAADGTRLFAFRVARPVGPISIVYTGASTSDGGRFVHWQRTAGAEFAFAHGSIRMISVPAVAAVAGVGRALDQPGKPIRGHLTVSLRP